MRNRRGVTCSALLQLAVLAGGALVNGGKAEVILPPLLTSRLLALEGIGALAAHAIASASASTCA